MTYALHIGARNVAGDPAEVIQRRGDFAVESQCGLNRDERPAGAHEMNKRLVEFFGLSGVSWIERDFDTGGSQFRESRAAYQRIGILDSGDNASDAGLDDGVGARLRAAFVGAGLEREI